MNNNNKKTSSRISARLILVMSIALAMAACEKKGDYSTDIKPTTTQPETTAAGELSALSESALPKLQLSVQNFCKTEQALFDAISTFKTKPDKPNLESTQHAWELSHQALMSFKVLQYLPISHPVLDHLPVGINDSDADNSDDKERLIEHSIWSRLDQTPLFGGYLDYVSQYPYSGITNSDLIISEKLLVKEFQFADDMYVTLGLHAIEFLLWGENGARDANDYNNLNNPEDTRVIRRMALLTTIANQLHTDTSLLCQSWQSIPLHYPQQLRQYSENQQLEIWLEAIKGAITLVIIPSLSEPHHSPFSKKDLEDVTLLAASFNHLLNKENLQIAQAGSQTRLANLLESLQTFEHSLKQLSQQDPKPSDTDSATKEGQNLVSLIDQIIDEV